MEQSRSMSRREAWKIRRSERGASPRTPRYDTYIDKAELPSLLPSILLIPVLVLPEVTYVGAAWTPYLKLSAT